MPGDLLCGGTRGTVFPHRVVVFTGALALAVASARAQRADCLSPDVGLLLDGAAVRLQAMDEGGAAALLDRAEPAVVDGCGELAVAQLGVRGWVEARALAAKGGDTALLGPVNTVLRGLDDLRRRHAQPPSGPPAQYGLAIDYAAAVIRAAVDAAQDERPEMAVYLEHARDLSAVLTGSGDAPLWPLPIDEVEGDLWLEVDRYAEARAAFERAARAARGARSLIGLARTADRQADPESACAAYRRALALDPAPSIATEARSYLGRACL